MAVVASSERIFFSDTPHGVSVVMTIYAPTSEEFAIQRLTSAEASEYGEEPLQLLEGLRYEYELSDPRYRLTEESGGGVVQQSSNPHLAHCGTLVTGLNTGKLVVLARDATDEIVGTAALEIRPRKLGHREHYRKMLEDITDVCVDLAMELRAPTCLKASPSPGTTSQTIHQRFSFLKALIGSRAFQDALHRISTYPHKRWEAEERIIDVHRGFRSNAKTMREIAKAKRRVPVPESHPLATFLATVPERIQTYCSSQTEDTKENQFVKFALETFSSFLRSMQRKLDELAAARAGRGLKKSEADARLQAQISTLESSLLHSLGADIFRNLSHLQILPFGSPVLQRKEGYREIFQAWLKFDMAARLVWHGGDDVYGAGQRDIATLYEYWVFFKLLSLVAEYFRFTSPLSDTLIEETDDGFGIKLKSGEQLAFDAIYNTGTRRLRVQFGYNRTFRTNTRYEVAGSWTERMRPDYTLSLWPCGPEDQLTAEEAERQDLMVHVHFDAKYRIDDLQEIFGKENGLSLEEAYSQGEGKYKRDDLLKMHAYRDAIRRTHGAYVLYPGDAQKSWEEYREILPGLGAFSLRPGNGEQALRKFIDDVVHHVCDRATQREQLAFHNYCIHKNVAPKSIFSPLPELHRNSSERLPPPADTFVLVAPLGSEDQLQWATVNGTFVLPIMQAGSLNRIDSKLSLARYILMCGPGLFPLTKFVAVRTEGAQIVTGATLKAVGCPAIEETTLYLTFEIEEATFFDSYGWEVRMCSELTIIPLQEVIYLYLPPLTSH